MNTEEAVWDYFILYCKWCPTWKQIILCLEYFTCTILVTGRIIWHIWRKHRYTFCLLLNRFSSSSQEIRQPLYTVSANVTYLFITITWSVWTATTVCWQLSVLYFISHDSFQKLLMIHTLPLVRHCWVLEGTIMSLFAFVSSTPTFFSVCLHQCDFLLLISKKILTAFLICPNMKGEHRHQTATLKWLCIFTDAI